MTQEQLRKIHILNYDMFKEVFKELGHLHESYIDEKFDEFSRDRIRYLINIDSDTFDMFMRKIGL